MSSETFDNRAKNWDNDPKKAHRAAAFAKEIASFLPSTKQLSALEFGCGTGLLSFLLKDNFKEISLVDSSKGMIEVLNEKVKKENIKIFKPFLIDIIKDNYNIPKTDVIYTLMSLHHIKNIEKALTVFHTLLNKNGYLCIGDLVEEDGSFHASAPDFDGHNGFDKKTIIALLRKNRFETVYYTVCFEMKKDTKKYPLFLLIAKKK